MKKSDLKGMKAGWVERGGKSGKGEKEGNESFNFCKPEWDPAGVLFSYSVKECHDSWKP